MNSSIAFIGGLGGPEMLMIFFVILLLFGAKKLPELARGVGKSMGEFKRAREDFEREIVNAEKEVTDETPKKTQGDLGKKTSVVSRDDT